LRDADSASATLRLTRRSYRFGRGRLDCLLTMRSPSVAATALICTVIPAPRRPSGRSGTRPGPSPPRGRGAASCEVHGSRPGPARTLRMHAATGWRMWSSLPCRLRGS